MPLPIQLTNDDGAPHGQKIPAARAGYMELQGAEKDADCRIVDVPGGVSQELGCCNEFQPKDESVQEFECGTCGYLVGKGGSRVPKRHEEAAEATEK